MIWTTIQNRINWIKTNLFNVLLILSIIFILVCAVFRIGKEGTWGTDYFYDPLPSLRGRVPVNIPPMTSPKRDSNGEIRARAFLERYFNRSFPKSRPNFMVNQVTGSKYNLELDCYNEMLRLAVEYNGAQHYNYIPFFHKNKEAFYNQKYRDEIKRIRCKELGINLIEIPYTEEKHLEKYLEHQLKLMGY